MDPKKVREKGLQMGVTGGIAGTIALAIVSQLMPNLTEMQSAMAVTFVTVLLAALIRMAHNYLKHKDDPPIDRVPREYRHLALFLPLVLLLASCASIPDAGNTAILTGTIVKEAAETAYSATYDSFLDGAVTPEEMQDADELYETYLAALAAYKTSVEIFMTDLGDSATLLRLQRELLDALADLQAHTSKTKAVQP